MTSPVTEIDRPNINDGGIKRDRTAVVSSHDEHSLMLRDRGIAWEIGAETSVEMDQAIAGFFGESV